MLGIFCCFIGGFFKPILQPLPSFGLTLQIASTFSTMMGGLQGAFFSSIVTPITSPLPLSSNPLFGPLEILVGLSFLFTSV